MNLSQNTAQTTTSAISCAPSQTKTASIGTSITYSSFADNTAKNYYCIYLSYSNSNAKEINNSNIIIIPGPRDKI